MTFLAAIGLLAGTFSAYGTTNYWDNNGETSGFGTAGGTWGTEGKWSSDSTGTSVPAVTNTTASDDLIFGTATDGLEAGTVSVDGTTQAFGTMTFGEASGEIILSGGTLNLAAPASTVTVNNSSNTIGSVLAGTNGLQKGTSGPLTYTSFLTASPTTIFPNKTLSDYVSAGGVIDGGWINRLPSVGYYFSNNGTTATYQLQALDGGYTKCVGIELTQVGADITARVRYAKNVSGSYLGIDFDPLANNGTIAISSGAGGYGAAETAIATAHVLTLTGVNTYSGDTTISNGVLEIGGSGVLGAGSYGGDIINFGTLLYSSASNQVLNGNISGSGSLVIETLTTVPVSETYTSFLPAKPNSVIILEKTMLSDCVAADGILGGTSITGGSSQGTPFFFVNDGTTATWQLQTVSDTPWTKCVKIELTQVGQDIAARVLYASHINNGSVLGYNFDESTVFDSIATSDSTGAYGAKQTTLTVNRHSTLTLSGSNSYSGGTTVNRGILEATATTSALPSSGGITVNDGGELKLNVPGLNNNNPGGVGNGNPITVNSGGILNLKTNFNAGYSRSITINGGTLNSTFYENNDGANYINNLTLMNGAQVIGYKMRVGYHSAASIVVSGTSPSSISAGINMVRTGTSPLTFIVADVTGDDVADLTIPGVIRDYDNGGFTNMPIIKSGDGTLELSAVNTHKGVITIDAGTISLAANSSLNTGNGIVLNGGTLDMGAYTNTVGTLTVDADSNIASGSGELAFADSSGTSWSGSLTVTGELGEQSVRFGTNSAALISTQLNAITINGGRAWLTPEGYLAVPPGGTIIMIQ